jgi:hypothetical protein
MRAAEYEADLFGEAHVATDAIPRRGSLGYERYLSELPLPNGLTFWSLGPEDEFYTGNPRNRFFESIWAVDSRGRHVFLVIDIRTGDAP